MSTTSIGAALATPSPARRDLMMLLLSVAGGSVDAVIILGFNVLTAAQTGNTILLATCSRSVAIAAIAMGVQSAIVLRLHVGPTTTYVTGTLTSFATKIVRGLYIIKAPDAPVPWRCVSARMTGSVRLWARLSMRRFLILCLAWGRENRTACALHSCADTFNHSPIDSSTGSVGQRCLNANHQTGRIHPFRVSANLLRGESISFVSGHSTRVRGLNQNGMYVF